MVAPSKDEQIEQSISTINRIFENTKSMESLASFYANMTQVSGLTALNAAVSQQQINILGTAIVAAGANKILGTGSSEKDGKMSSEDFLNHLQKLMAIASAPAQQNPVAANVASTPTPPSAES